MKRSRFDLDNKVVLVTGAAGGVGYECARQFLHAGCRVAMVDINAALLSRATAQLESELGKERVFSLCCDLADTSAADHMVATVVEHWNGIDVLVNNAVLGMGGRFVEQAPERMQSMLMVNLFAPMYLCQKVLPIMVGAGAGAGAGAGGGHVVNVFSSSATAGTPGFSCYGATKSGLATLTKILRREYLGSGVTFYPAVPGVNHHAHV